MTFKTKFACHFPNALAKQCVLLHFFSVVLLVSWSVAAAANGQNAHDDSANTSKFGAIDFPYQAIVAGPMASVYSGPDQVHYATDQLPAGEVVVVYRHDPNGWCAIQPPAGSFSLLPEAAVEKINDGLGILIQDQVQAWVGTRLGSVDKPLWQVKLRADEEVEIIGEASWPSPDGHSTIWYQIAPPAGEFRWVKIADLKVPSAGSRSLPVDRNLAVDQELARTAFTEVDIDDDRFVQQTASWGDQSSRTKTDASSGFVYRSEAGNRSKATDPYAAPIPPVIVERSTTPEVDNATIENAKIDFKFRPIGKTANRKSVAPNKNLSAKALTAIASPTPSKRADANSNRLKQEKDKIAQATYQSPAQLPSAGLGQWKAAANSLKSTSQKAGNRLAGRTLNSNLPDSLLTRGTSAGVVEPTRPSAEVSPWGSKDEAGSVMSDDVSLDLQWEREQNTPNTRRFNQTPLTQADSSNDAIQEQVIIGSALHSKLSPQLSNLEMALTNEMLKRPNEWQLSDIELTVEQVYSQTKNPVERLQAQRILDKLKNCKKIRNGYAKSFHSSGETFGTSLSPALRQNNRGFGGANGLAAARGRLNRFASNGQPSVGSAYGSSSVSAGGNAIQGLVGTGVDTDFESGALYDAHGWLTELVSSDRNNRPVYVLVNDDGKITHHIAPSPGLNLHRYLKSKVGVNGRQGYNNVLKLSHVTADAVSELIRR